MDEEVFFCELCKLNFSTDEELKEHGWSLLHHRKLDKEKGRDIIHTCELCKVDIFGLLTFTKHIHSEKHIAEVTKLKYSDKQVGSSYATTTQPTLYTTNHSLLPTPSGTLSLPAAHFLPRIRYFQTLENPLVTTPLTDINIRNFHPRSFKSSPRFTTQHKPYTLMRPHINHNQFKFVRPGYSPKINSNHSHNNILPTAMLLNTNKGDAQHIHIPPKDNVKLLLKIENRKIMQRRQTPGGKKGDATKKMDIKNGNIHHHKNHKVNQRHSTNNNNGDNVNTSLNLHQNGIGQFHKLIDNGEPDKRVVHINTINQGNGFKKLSPSSSQDNIGSNVRVALKKSREVVNKYNKKGNLNCKVIINVKRNQQKEKLDDVEFIQTLSEESKVLLRNTKPVRVELSSLPDIKLRKNKHKDNNKITFSAEKNKRSTNNVTSSYKFRSKSTVTSNSQYGRSSPRTSSTPVLSLSRNSLNDTSPIVGSSPNEETQSTTVPAPTLDSNKLHKLKVGKSRFLYHGVRGVNSDPKNTEVATTGLSDKNTVNNAQNDVIVIDNSGQDLQSAHSKEVLTNNLPDKNVGYEFISNENAKSVPKNKRRKMDTNEILTDKVMKNFEQYKRDFEKDMSKRVQLSDVESKNIDGKPASVDKTIPFAKKKHFKQTKVPATEELNAQPEEIEHARSFSTSNEIESIYTEDQNMSTGDEFAALNKKVIKVKKRFKQVVSTSDNMLQTVGILHKHIPEKHTIFNDSSSIISENISNGISTDDDASSKDVNVKQNKISISKRFRIPTTSVLLNFSSLDKEKGVQPKQNNRPIDVIYTSSNDESQNSISVDDKDRDEGDASIKKRKRYLKVKNRFEKSSSTRVMGIIPSNTSTTYQMEENGINVDSNITNGGNKSKQFVRSPSESEVDTPSDGESLQKLISNYVYQSETELPTGNVKHCCEFKKNNGTFCDTISEQRFCDYHQRVLKAVELYISKKVAACSQKVADAVSLIDISDNTSESQESEYDISNPTKIVIPDNIYKKPENLNSTELGSFNSVTDNKIELVGFRSTGANSLSMKENTEPITSESNDLSISSISKTMCKQSRFKYLKNLSTTQNEVNKANLPPTVRKLLDKKNGYSIEPNVRIRTSSQSESESENVNFERKKKRNERSNLLTNAVCNSHIPCGIDETPSNENSLLKMINSQNDQLQNSLVDSDIDLSILCKNTKPATVQNTTDTTGHAVCNNAKFSLTPDPNILQKLFSIQAPVFTKNTSPVTNDCGNSVSNLLFSLNKSCSNIATNCTQYNNLIQSHTPSIHANNVQADYLDSVAVNKNLNTHTSSVTNSLSSPVTCTKSSPTVGIMQPSNIKSIPIVNGIQSTNTKSFSCVTTLQSTCMKSLPSVIASVTSLHPCSAPGNDCENDSSVNVIKADDAIDAVLILKDSTVNISTACKSTAVNAVLNENSSGNNVVAIIDSVNSPCTSPVDAIVTCGSKILPFNTISTSVEKNTIETNEIIEIKDIQIEVTDIVNSNSIHTTVCYTNPVPSSKIESDLKMANVLDAATLTTLFGIKGPVNLKLNKSSSFTDNEDYNSATSIANSAQDTMACSSQELNYSSPIIDPIIVSTKHKPIVETNSNTSTVINNVENIEIHNEKTILNQENSCSNQINATDPVNSINNSTSISTDPATSIDKSTSISTDPVTNINNSTSISTDPVTSTKHSASISDSIVTIITNSTIIESDIIIDKQTNINSDGNSYKYSPIPSNNIEVNNNINHVSMSKDAAKLTHPTTSGIDHSNDNTMLIFDDIISPIDENIDNYYFNISTSKYNSKETDMASITNNDTSIGSDEDIMYKSFPSDDLNLRVPTKDQQLSKSEAVEEHARIMSLCNSHTGNVISPYRRSSAGDINVSNLERELNKLQEDEDDSLDMLSKANKSLERLKFEMGKLQDAISYHANRMQDIRVKKKKLQFTLSNSCKFRGSPFNRTPLQRSLTDTSSDEDNSPSSVYRSSRIVKCIAITDECVGYRKEENSNYDIPMFIDNSNTIKTSNKQTSKDDTSSDDNTPLSVYNNNRIVKSTFVNNEYIVSPKVNDTDDNSSIDDCSVITTASMSKYGTPPISPIPYDISILEETVRDASDIYTNDKSI